MYLRRVLNGHLVYHTSYFAIEESLQREALLSIRPGRAPSGAAGNAQAGAMTMKGAKTDTEWFSPEELAAAREEYLQEQEKEQPSPQVKLRYAIALAKSRKRDDKYRAIGLLEDLLDQSYAPKESLYWIALTLCGLGEYRASRSYCERLLRMEPSHMKAQLLHKRIKEVVAREDGVVGVGIVGAVVVAGLALKFLLKR